MCCSKCKMPIPTHARLCPACQTDVGFPNVRAATTQEERSALAQRLKDAEVSIRARACEAEFVEFGRHLESSKAVVCRSVGIVARLVSSDNELYQSFYKAVQSGQRLPEDNAWDSHRGAVDATIFPHYADEIVFAALSLDGRGMEQYGEVSLVLRDDFIADRATVFEEDCFDFMRRHMVVVGDPIPHGYRASWTERHKLGMAKLHSRLSKDIGPQEFPQILLRQSNGKDNGDCIEVHIYGGLHRRAIEKVKATAPGTRADRVLLQSVARKVQQVGSTVEVTS